MSPATISNVIAELKEKRLVKSVPGKGVYVAVDPDKDHGSEQPATGQKVIALAGLYLPGENRLQELDHAQLGRLPIINELYHAALRMRHMLVLLPDSDERVDMSVLKNMDVDGLILLGGYPREALMTMCRSSTPLILSNDPREPLPLSYVDYDTEGSIADMVDRFVDAGHKRIGYVGFETSVKGYIDHLRTCFVENLLQKDLCYHFYNHWCVAPLSNAVPHEYERLKRVGEELVERLFDQEETPTAVYCAQQSLLPGVRSGLEKLGRRVPEDVSLMVCYDFPEEGECSGLVHPRQELALKLIEELLAIIEDPSYFNQTKLRLPFVDRGTIREMA